ncbi:uncharacterized protein LODBEIA_P33310 [Lodderomyces beijingensis]|uniref:Nucleolar complex protein 14 n=1 Tax=Lodderomyces beijingensis TaxID=1775926 RepID=A0ABP0ZS54_9ASCO
MAGSQLKQLKSALREKGLLGQTNTKKSKKSKTSRRNEVDRDLQKQNLFNVRSEFNKFDQRINRSKHDVSITAGKEFVKVGSKQHNDATAKKGAMQKQMKSQYDLEKRKKGRTGGILDKRFGENDVGLSQEEKMLARFTRERQAATANTRGKKRGLYSLESEEEEEDDDEDDDDNNGGFQLTHSGHALSFDDENTINYVDEDRLVRGGEEQGDAAQEPQRKKSKNEVMKEIIAKSKFYKQQRQQTFAKTQDQIDELDEDFGDVMDDLRGVQQSSAPGMNKKTPEDREYDSRVRELTYDRRAVPADRTKTEEELHREHEEKRQKLEQDRLRRMEGFVSARAAEGDDLDENDDDVNGFWGGDSENEEDGFRIKGDGDEEEEEEGEEEEDDDDDDEGKEESEGVSNRKPVSRKSAPVVMPLNVEDFIQQVSSLNPEKQAQHVQKICDAYKPNLAMGNKEKMNQFVSIIFEYALHLANKFEPLQPILTVLKRLSSTYNEQLVETMRQYIGDIESRVESTTSAKLQPSDLTFFVIVAFLFSTSDHYHLIVTPSLILMNQILSNVIYRSKDDLKALAQGVFLTDVLLTYQRFAKRFDPEIVNFIEFAFLSLVPQPEQVDVNKVLSMRNPNSSLNLVKSAKYPPEDPSITSISLEEVFSASEANSETLKVNLLLKLITIMDKAVSLWRDKPSLIEILSSFLVLLKHLTKYTAITTPYLEKFTKLCKASANSRRPLELQHHKAIGIATYAPKFEENFNPDKKSYDPNAERQQLAKVKAQLKKEQKAALKDIRYENRFLAREQIGEKKQMYDDYHRKMAHIYNSIQSEEGKERNDYEREKKSRKNRK